MKDHRVRRRIIVALYHRHHLLVSSCLVDRIIRPRYVQDTNFASLNIHILWSVVD